MTALFEMRIRTGGDPQGFGEFMALRDELAKLSHPACPDVSWVKVEQLCLSLFQNNGADLQTAAFYALARSHRQGLAGMVEGVGLIDALSCEWPRLWPPVASLRLDILNWLFAQWQPLLRGLLMDTRSLPALVHLDTELSRLNQRLDAQAQVPMVTLQALRQQVDSLMRRLQQNTASGETVQLSTRVPEPPFVMPVVILPPPRMLEAGTSELKTKRRRISRWLFAVATAIALTSWFGWKHWLAGQDSDRSLADPVRLDSLMLFDAGSAEFNSDSTKVLINALGGIKARPGWLIVIVGHSDASGDAGQNLALSRARASAVRDWMQRMGDIPGSCFAVQGLAATQPITSNDTESGRAANRRVDIRLVPQEGACGS
jgi:type VI secretion system protein VasL